MLSGLLQSGIYCTSPETAVTIKLTNPQGKTVGYTGYYRLQSAGESIPINGGTPGEYDVKARTAGDRVEGVVNKTSATDTDTLKLEIVVGDVEAASGATTSPYFPIHFGVPVGPH